MKRCSCCGIFLVGAEVLRDRCLVCGVCDHMHGDELEARVVRLVAAGSLPWGRALACMLVDDAHHAVRLRFHGDPMACEMAIDEPVHRWEVVIGRALARGEVPDLSRIVAAVLARYIPGRATTTTLEAIERDMTEALQMFDPDVLSVKVTARRDHLDPEHLIIECSTRNPVGPAVLDIAPEVAIPSDISSRPRGQA